MRRAKFCASLSTSTPISQSSSGTVNSESTTVAYFAGSSSEHNVPCWSYGATEELSVGWRLGFAPRASTLASQMPAQNGVPIVKSTLIVVLTALSFLAVTIRLHLDPDVASLLPEHGEAAALKRYVRAFGGGDLS